MTAAISIGGLEWSAGVWCDADAARQEHEASDES
jgi:hypothetical protein